MSDFTPEQQQILAEQEEHFVILASAGAGKTRMLVERYLRHVLVDNLRPEQILTMTFTRKAAGEMKQRIVEDLRKLGHVSEAQAAETGPIQTIDAFCERLLRENAVEAGVDPEFESIGEGLKWRLRDRAFQSTLAEVSAEHAEARELISRLASRVQGESWHSQLGKDVWSVIDKLRSTSLHPVELMGLYATPALFVEQAHAAIWEAFPPQWQEVDRPRTEPGAAFVQACRDIGKGIGTRLPVWLKVAPQTEDEFRLACGFMQIALDSWLRFESLMNVEQAFDFSAIASRAIRALEESEVVRRRVQAKYRVLMIDEFQDVSQVQKRLVDALGIERSMKVGDPQQSIYRFRHADPRIMTLEVGATPTRVLSKNHRSDPGILRFVDRLFGQMLGDRYRPMLHEPDLPGFEALGSFEGVEYWPTEAKDYASTAHRLWALHREGVAWSKIAVLMRGRLEIQALTVYLQALEIPYRTGKYESIYTRMEVRDLANALVALVDPRDDFAMLAMLHSPVVGLSLDAVALLATCLPVLDALEGFESPVEADREKLAEFLDWFRPLSAFADRLTAWELLAEVIRSSRLLATLAERPNAFETIANVRNLLVLAAGEPDVDPKSYAEQIRNLQKLRHVDESSAPRLANEDAVTLSTIHGAKGLEFEVVVLGGLAHTRKAGVRAPIADMDTGLVATKYMGHNSELFALLQHRETEEEIAEDARLLYVALTRAKHRLCLVVHPNADPRSASAIILGKMGPEPPGVLIRELTPHLKVSH